MTTDAENEWISTVEASILLGASYERTRQMLKQLDCTRRESNGRATDWRVADVLAAKELLPEVEARLERKGGRSPRQDVTTAARKPCMCCGAAFESQHKFHRLCDLCRYRDSVEHSLTRRRK